MTNEKDTDNSKCNPKNDGCTEKKAPLPLSNYTPVRSKLVEYVIDRLIIRHFKGSFNHNYMNNLYDEVERGASKTNIYTTMRSMSYDLTGIIKSFFGKETKYNFGYIDIRMNDDNTINQIQVIGHGTPAKYKRFAQDIADVFPTVDIELRFTADSASLK
jgi:hypothetical protein